MNSKLLFSCNAIPMTLIRLLLRKSNLNLLKVMILISNKNTRTSKKYVNLVNLV